jgi:DNA-binding phage protein
MSRIGTYAGFAPRASLAMGAAGAILGGSIAAARNISRVEKQEMTREEAVRDVLKESGTTGLSTAMATAVVSATGLTGILSLVGLVSVAVGAKYLADKAMTGQCTGKRTSKPQALPAKSKPKTGAAKPKKAG